MNTLKIRRILIKNGFSFACRFGIICLCNLVGLADEISCSTNQDGFALFLTFPKTNFVSGEKIPATIIVSNMVTVERRFDWATGNPCDTGFGEFRIVEKNSNAPIDCQLRLEDRVNFLSQSLDYLDSHQAKSFEINLVYGYALTNAGLYSVQFVGHFRSLNSPDKIFVLITPSVAFSISSRHSGTNSITPHQLNVPRQP